MEIGRLGIRCIGAALVLMVTGLLALGTAQAAEPVGACCFANGSCQELLESVCATQDGSFIGAGIACAVADCTASVTAPLLSIGGVIAAIGALAALGTWRLLARR